MDLLTAQELALKLMQEFNLLPDWTFEFDNAKRRFGCCHRSSANIIGGKITLSRELVLRNDAAQVEDVIRHEIAHALCPRKVGHGPVWKAKCKVTGANPERCYDSEAVETPDAEYVAVCGACGTKYERQRRPRGEWWCADKACTRKHGRMQEIQKLHYVHRSAIPKPEALRAGIEFMKAQLSKQGE